MLNNRKYINELKMEIGYLKIDVENKENEICNLLNDNKELAIENIYLKEQLEELREIKAKLEGQLEKVRNHCLITTEIDILKGEM